MEPIEDIERRRNKRPKFGDCVTHSSAEAFSARYFASLWIEKTMRAFAGPEMKE